jgi:hypothetical protein
MCGGSISHGRCFKYGLVSISPSGGKVRKLVIECLGQQRSPYQSKSDEMKTRKTIT